MIKKSLIIFLNILIIHATFSQGVTKKVTTEDLISILNENIKKQLPLDKKIIDKAFTLETSIQKYQMEKVVQLIKHGA